MSPEEWLASQSEVSAPAETDNVESLSPEQWAELQTPETTSAGLSGAVTRGLALPAAGAVMGAMAGAPIGGVGAIPGAIAGAGAATLAQVVGDPIVSTINGMFGTKYTMPTDAMEDLLTRVGVPEAKSQAERIVQATAAGAGGAGGMALAGKGMQSAASSPLLQGIGAKTAEHAAAQVTGGAGAGLGFQAAKEAGMGTPESLGAAAVGALAGAVLPGKPRVAAAVRAVPKAGTSMIVRPGQAVARTVTGQQSPKMVDMAKVIKDNPYNADTAAFKLSGPYSKAAQVDDAAKEALKQGWRPKFIAAVKASSPEDYSAARKMVNLYEMGMKRANVTTRPTDIVGETMLKRIDYIGKTKREAGAEIEKAADGLRGKQVDYSPAMANFAENLQKIGVKMGRDVESPDFTVGDIGVSMRGSDIEGDAGSKVLLERVFRRLSTDTPDGYHVHTAKRWLDNQVEYGKKSQTGLLGDTERVVKKLRADLNQSLRDSSPEYEQANVKYKDTLDAMESLQNSIGTKVDLDGPNVDKALGTEARKLLTNYQARVNMLTALDDMESVAKKYGMKVDDSVMNQILVTNELDRMFGSVAEGSFKGQIEQAIRPGIQVAQGNARQAAIELATGLIDKARGINEENAIKALKKLLSEKQTVESAMGKKSTLPAIRKQ